MKGTPGEKYHLATPGRYPSTLDEVFDSIERNQSLDWSGHFHGDPEVVNNIIQTQEYELNPDQVLPVSGGTSMGNFLTCQALLKPGDEIICETPAWTQVANIAGRMGVKINWWYLRPENNWQPRLEELKRLINPKTKLIYLCNPNNPTGSVLSKEILTQLGDIAAKYGTYILSDEIYRGLEWQSNELSASIVNLYERGISTCSLTKVLGVCGIRFGWFATRDKPLQADCFDIYYDSALCNNILSEKIASKLLEPARYSELLQEGKALGRQNLKVLTEVVNRNDVLSMRPPQGAYCCFVKVDTGEPSWDLCKRLLQMKPFGVALVPGITYNDYCEYHVRIGFGAKPEVLKSALKIVEEGLKPPVAGTSSKLEA